MCQLPSVHPIRQKITTNHVSTTISASYEDRRSQRIMCQHHQCTIEERSESCVNYHQCILRGQKITTNHVSTTISAPYEDRRSQRIMCQLPSVHPMKDRRSQRIMCQLPSVHHTRTEDHNESCEYHQCRGQKITTDHVSTTISIRGQKITTNHVLTTISAPYEDRRSHRIMCQLPSVHPIRTEDHNESCVNYHQCTIRGQKITTNHVSTTISASTMCQLPSVTEDHNESCVNYHQCTIRGQKITNRIISVSTEDTIMCTPISAGGQKITTNHVSTTISASYEDRRSQRIMCQLHQCILRGQKITTNHVSTTISAPYEDRRSQRIMCQLPSVHHTRTEDHNESCVNYHQCTIRGQKITTNHVSTTISASYEDRRSQRIMCQLPSVHYTRTEDHNESCVNYHQCTIRGQKITTNHVSTTISASYEDRRSQRIMCQLPNQCINAYYKDRRSQRIMCQLPSVHHMRREDHNESCVNYHQCTIRGQKITTNHVSTTISASRTEDHNIMCQLPSVHHTRTEDHNESCVNYHQCIIRGQKIHNESCVNYHQCIIRGQKITTNHVSTTISASYEDRRSRTNHVSTTKSVHYHHEDRRSQRIMC